MVHLEHNNPCLQKEFVLTTDMFHLYEVSADINHMERYWLFCGI